MFTSRIFRRVSLAVAILPAVATTLTFAQNRPVRPLPIYHVVHGWPILPDNEMLDEVSAVAVDSRGNVLILTRGGRKWPKSDILDTSPIPKETIFVIDGHTGRFLSKFGKSIFALPHSITIDANDNIWVADVALHQVFKLSPDGKVLLTIGERAKPGIDDARFNRPADVAVATDGSFYVSDGYGNSRVMKFSVDGRFLLKWGEKGAGQRQLSLPHSIALDRNGHVYVVDRDNNRIQIFDSVGKYIAEWKGPFFASPQAIKVGANGYAYVADGGSEKLPDRAGVTILRPDGSFVGRFGRFGNYDGQFVDLHWIAVGADGSIYTADFEGKRVQKFVPKRH